jgi:glycosyltransferase involved in cell wall biosynthesis
MGELRGIRVTPRPVHVVVPGRLDQRTGGYLYDARMVRGLRARGHSVVVHELAGTFPQADALAAESMQQALASVGDGEVAVVDGLAGGALPELLARESRRLRLIALVHHPLADETGLPDDVAARLAETERSALAACRGAIVTSGFTAERLRSFGVRPGRVRVAPPGTTPARPARGPAPTEPPRLICVASVTPRKGHPVLVEALASVTELPWTCVLAGSEELDPAHAHRVRAVVEAEGLEDRVAFLGELDTPVLESWYDRSTLFVLPSYYEGYGMALCEALARGLPVLSTTGGAIPYTVPAEAGVLVPPGDPHALADALRALLSPDGQRLRALRAGALRSARELPDWPEAVVGFERALWALADVDPVAGDSTRRHAGASPRVVR